MRKTTPPPQYSKDLEPKWVKDGDLIQLGEHRLLCGDSANQENILRLLEGVTPTLMVTDPPYGVEYDPEWREGNDLGVGERSTGKVANDDRADWTEVWKLWPTTVIYCWHASLFTSIVQSSLQAVGYKMITQIIWAKQHFALSRGDYHWQHEPCWYAARGPHNWQGARDQASVWEIKNNNSFGNSEKEETFGHGTQKPIECMARPIRNNSKEGDVICDPFLGSGTTLIACEILGRKCLGMEIMPIYCEQIIQRYKSFCDKNNKTFSCKINGELFEYPETIIEGNE